MEPARSCGPVTWQSAESTERIIGGTRPPSPAGEEVQRGCSAGSAGEGASKSG